MTSPVTVPELDQQQPKPTEATVSDPQTKTGKEVADELGLTDELKKALLDIRKIYKQKYQFNRRRVIQRIARNFEYGKGNQYIVWDPQAGRFFSPFDDNPQGTDSGNDDLGFYKYINNVIQWLHRVYVASLSGLTPKTRFWPEDVEQEADLAAADEASKAEEFIEQQNNISSLLKQILTYIFFGGSYFRYTRYLRDEDRAGSHQEPVFEIVDGELSPNQYICPRCGADNPVDAMNPMAPKQCAQCGAPLNESDFYPAVTGPMPQLRAVKDVPNGQVCWSVYTGLNVDVDPRVNDSSRDPIYQSPIVDLEDEADLAALRACYPTQWDKLKSAVNSGAGENSDIARVARNRLYSTMSQRGIQGLDQSPTFSRCWIQPWAFNILDGSEGQKKAEALKEKFPNGCLLVSINGETVLDVRQERVADHWTWGACEKGFGAYPPAPCDHAIPFQDRINDAANATHQYMDRKADPDVLVNTDLISFTAINNKGMGSGGYIPVKPKSTLQGMVTQGLGAAFFQPKFEIDQHIWMYGQELWQAVQTLLGVTPQMFGGSDPNIQTASGQGQALSTSRGIMALTYDNVREEHANAALISVKCLRDNATDDPVNVVKSDTGFKNQRIRLDALQGNFRARPEADQGYPTTFAERQAIIKEMVMNAAKNPVIQEFLKPLVNQKLVAMHIAPEGFEIPGETARNNTLRDIETLYQQEPMLAQGPMGPVPMPSIQPDADLLDADPEYPRIALEATCEWMEKDLQQKQAENPGGFENVRLYLKLLVQHAAAKQMAMQPALPPGAPPAAQA